MKTQNEQLEQIKKEIKNLQDAHKQTLIGGNDYTSALHHLYKKEKELLNN
jgi:hypothetical protein